MKKLCLLSLMQWVPFAEASICMIFLVETAALESEKASGKRKGSGKRPCRQWGLKQ